jgi:hypothetical protein
MNDMGGIADKREAMGNECARDPKAERKDAPRADRFDLAEMEAEAPLELAVETGVR